MFADDLLLFRESREKQIKRVMHTLDMFCNASGQQVSSERTSIIFSMNTNRRGKDDILRVSDFR